MMIRKSTASDLLQIMKIIHQAQQYFGSQGIDQWQNGYPNEHSILHDIETGSSYVFIEDDRILATFCLSFDGEETYERIYEGQWLSNAPYGVIHRIAVEAHQKGRGIAAQILSYAQTSCKEHEVASMKIDTHQDNHSMQKMLGKNGFQYCGIIYLKDGSKRVAYEWMIDTPI